MYVLKGSLAAALIAGGVSSFAGSANAVPLSASLALRDAATPMVETVQWRRWGGGWGRVGFGFAAGALVGAALTAPYYGGYYGGYGGGYGGYGGCYGCYPAYSYGYSYPAYSYAYAPSYYSYGYAPAYSYSYGYPG